MSSEEDQSQEHTDALDRLIGAAMRKHETDGISLPDIETTLAAIEGRASSDQQKSVDDALLNSDRYRRTYIGLKRDLEELAAASQDLRDNPREVILPQRIAERLRVDYGKDTGSDDSIPLVIKILIPTLVLAATVIFTVVGPDPTIPNLDSEWASVQRNKLQIVETLGGSQDDSFTNSNDAALWQLRRLVSFNSQTKSFELLPQETPSIFSRTIFQSEFFVISNLNGDLLTVFPIDQTLDFDSDTNEITIWLLNHKTESIISVEVSSNSILVDLPADWQGAVALVYQNRDRYSSAGGSVVTNE